MLIEAVVEKGQVRFLQPITFLHDCFAVKIDVPDREIVAEAQTKRLGTEAESVPAEYLAFRALQEAAFGNQYKHEVEKTDREIMQAHWMDKHA